MTATRMELSLRWAVSEAKLQARLAAEASRLHHDRSVSLIADGFDDDARRYQDRARREWSIYRVMSDKWGDLDTLRREMEAK